ncbi:MAG TPA: PQQ-binding-like beta-propeller repeat protein [Anaerolineae bacterium]
MRKPNPLHPSAKTIGILLIIGLTLGVTCSPTTSVTRGQTEESTYIYLPTIARNSFSGDEWTQEAHDAQRTGYTSEEPNEPWTLLWTWNGPDANGGNTAHFYDAPREARTVTGGSYVYVPAGTHGLYALAKTNGQIGWHVANVTFNATPAYDPSGQHVFAGGANGLLYKINAQTGAVVQTFTASGPLNRGVLLVGSYAYVVTNDGDLHKVNTATMSSVWTYTANSTASTGLAYSASRDTIVLGTDDLYVHAVNNSDGTRKWRTKPSPNPAGFPNEYRWYWPVVADVHGVVFLRMRLDHNAGLWGYPSSGHVWPNTNAQARTFLQNNPQYKNLFALNLDNGTEKFIPAVGYGGTEDLVDGEPYLTTGPVPVVKVLPDGKEVAYIIFRNGQSNPLDGRWDSHMGEMVLDNTTVPGLVAGDLRFVKMSRYNGYGGNSYVYITDTQNAISMAGDTLFHAHWGASESVKITDRSNSRGLTYSNPIPTLNHPAVIRRITACGTKNSVTHWTTCGLSLYNDGTYWDGPGWWTYWNVLDPPTVPSGAYSDGMRPRYTYVSDGLVIVEGNGGELMVFRHR